MLLQARKKDKLLPEAALFLALYWKNQKKESKLATLLRDMKAEGLHDSERMLIDKLKNEVQAGNDIRALQVALERLKALQ